MEWAEKAWDAAISLLGFCKVHGAYIYKMEDNLKILQEKMDDLQDLSADVLTRVEEVERTGEKQRINQVKGWLQKVEKLQKELKIVLSQGDQVTDTKCLGGYCPCLSSYMIGKKVVRMLNTVDEMVLLGKTFADKTTIISDDLPLTASNLMPLEETIGLDWMFDQVWSCLVDEKVSIIGLHGMGGVGKTTLLKRIRNEFERSHDFIVVWVVVSKDLDTNKIINDIGKKLRIKGKDWNEISPDQRAEKIYQVLREKKFVLLLDDLWEKLELDKFGIPQPNDHKSKILFTTRSKDVCAKMQAQKKFQVECLSEHEAFSLFCKKVGEETLKCHGEIPKLAKEIAKECGGLPLALVTVGCAMAGVESVEAWRQAKIDLRGCSWTALEVENKVFLVLKFSYEKLPDETHRRCFLYCSLYPEDYEVNVDSLIYRWIGEGFLDKDNTEQGVYDMYMQGKSVIEKLKLSCLLESVGKNDINGQPYIKMHDVIRDMALWLARDEDRKKEKVIVEGEALALTPGMSYERLNGVERISIIDADGWQKVPVCPNLITLCMRNKRWLNDYSDLQYMTKLKVLDLSDSHITNIPPKFGNLINLEFLDLSRTEVKNKLPIQLKNLKKLRILLMKRVWFSLDIIPLEVIESLEQLKVFKFTCFSDYNGLANEERFIEKLESLPKLEELCIQLTTITGMHKLHQSPKFRECLTYYMLDGIKEPVEMTSIVECWSTMERLQHIWLQGVENIMEGSTYNSHLQNLHTVYIQYCHSITHLTWLRCAPLLERLYVVDCELIEEVVKEDGGSSKDNNENDIFPNLTHLSLERLLKLKIIHKKVLSFPFLKLISVQSCPNLRELPLDFNSAKNTLISISGKQDWWNNLEWEDQSLKDKLPFIAS